jgi:hypothetical protein
VNTVQSQLKRHRKALVRKAGPAQRKLGKIGAPSKFELTNTAKLIEDIARGVPVEIACAAVGIDARSFYRWLDQRPEFSQALSAEKQRVILEALAGIRVSTKNDEWRGHAWFLERVYKDYFGPPVPGAILGVQQNFTITIEKAKEIESQRAQLLPEVKAMLGLTDGEANGSEPAEPSTPTPRL